MYIRIENVYGDISEPLLLKIWNKILRENITADIIVNSKYLNMDDFNVLLLWKN